MRCIKIFLLLAGLFLSAEGNAQSENCITFKTDSIETDIFNNQESDFPFTGLNKLQEPVLYTLNGRRLKVSKLSEVNIGEDAVESITIIQNGEELKEKGYSGYNSAVEVVTEKDEQKE